MFIQVKRGGMELSAIHPPRRQVADPPRGRVLLASVAERKLRRFLFALLLAQKRKQDDIADLRTVGQQHHQPVDADPEPSRGRHAVAERFDEIVVHLGHRILFGHALKLRLEKLLLQIGIVKLRVSVANSIP